MPFNSYSFIVFFVIVLAGYYGLRNWRHRKALLLVASYVFYAAWNPPFVILLWISTIADWILARRIHLSDSSGKRRLYLVGSLGVNLGLLGYFKYGGFAWENVSFLLEKMGGGLPGAVPNIILPVGISFYTFQTLSYTLDVYRGKLKPWHSFLDYALYVTFFPQLVAGPIVRAVDFLPQCDEVNKERFRNLGWGFSLIVLGLFEKVAMADGILAPVVEAVYDKGAPADCVSAWVGTIAFAGQIFCDFAGYSLCAIGAAMCLGFGLPDNFHFPYGAVGFSDFWRRWHISLSTWLRDYLYIPLGGNSKGLVRTMANLLITMFLGGLWHGARWTFVVWGLLHGVYLVVERLLKAVIPARLIKPFWVRFVLSIMTFAAVTVAWVFFRAHSFQHSFALIQTMFAAGGEEAVRLTDIVMIVKVAIVVGGLFLIHWFMRNRTLEEVMNRVPWPLQSLWLAVMLLGIMLLSGEDRAFIYFQF